MDVIKQVGEAHPSFEEAEDTLAGALAVPGVLFGYVDKKHRVVIFATDYYPESELQSGQERVNLKFRPTEPSSNVDLSPIADALLGKGPFVKKTN